MNKKDLTEQEIRTRYITPAIQDAGWKKNQIREELYLTAGQIYPRGKVALRGKRKFADYVLYYQALSAPSARTAARSSLRGMGLRRGEAFRLHRNS